ncbi:hypothetical protein DSO57_1028387 [Entomophthora muscae]|uniref:Uncharacterized protein n=1 Tax=Entomophthora muscae TaxID=34485 RepID=A0ACC2T1K9_9FUNG|nr:hypothetical protein DSO57_1028387 [Entomophthora muscae]
MSQSEEVTTLFMVGFPDDFTEREFQNMFLFATGFEAAMLKMPESQQEPSLALEKQQALMGFAKFKTRQEAIAAQQLLNGKLVDQERVSVLKVELAKKNLHIKRAAQRLGDSEDQAHVFETKEAESDLEKSWEIFVDDLVSTEASPEEPELPWLVTPAKAPADFQRAFCITPSKVAPGFQTDRAKKSFDDLLKYPTDTTFDSSYDSGYEQSRFFSPFSTMPSSNAMFSEKMQLTNHLTQLNLSSPVSSTFPSAFRPSSNSFSDRRAIPQSATAMPNGDHNPPCNTLYVGNLPPKTNEEELRQLFSLCAGYKRLCVRYKAGVNSNSKAGPMCFVEFESEDDAADAMHEKNGTHLSNSDKGGIRLSFSKNPLGVRRQPPPIATDVASPTQSSFRPPLTGATAPGLSFPGFSNPVTPISSQFKSLDRPLAPWG